jgi:hypothetical protein
MSTTIDNGTEWIFLPTRRKRETEAREMLAAYVGADAKTRDTLRAGWIDLLLSRQAIDSDAHRADLHAKHKGFMARLDTELEAYVTRQGDEERAALVKTYRSFVRRLVLPHHYLV